MQTKNAAAALTAVLAESARLEARGVIAKAARLLDEGLARNPGAHAPLRFRALLLRTELAVAMNEPGEGRGILAEARQIRLAPEEHDALAAELRRAEDLEAFFTHRGCAG